MARGRPAFEDRESVRTRQLQFRMPERELAQLKRLAAAQRVRPGVLARDLVLQGLKAQPNHLL